MVAEFNSTMATNHILNIFLIAFAFGKLDIINGQTTGQCGVTFIPPTIGSLTRIVGGNVAKPNSYPWMASLQVPIGSKEMTHICGGTLIRTSDTIEASDIIITAAHCLDSDPTHVLLGAHSQTKPSPGQQMTKVAKTVGHPSYSEAIGQNDFAIIKLENPVNFTQTIQPACLPSADEQLKDGAKGIVTGWGLLKETDEEWPDVLYQAALPISNIQQCKSNFYKIHIDEKIHFCAGYPQGGVDTCSEDSGGPFIMKNANGRYVLQGVVNFGIGCARANKPGVYARVSGFLPWIKEQTKNLSAVKKP